MKKFKVFKALLAAFFLIVSFSSYAQNCNQAAGQFAKGFDNVTAKIKKCTSYDEMDRIDWGSAFLDDFLAIPSECYDHLLSTFDKNKIRASFNRYVDTMVEKKYEFSGRRFSSSYLNEEFKPLRTRLLGILDKSDTLEELATQMAEF